MHVIVVLLLGMPESLHLQQAFLVLNVFQVLFVMSLMLCLLLGRGSGGLSAFNTFRSLFRHSYFLLLFGCIAVGSCLVNDDLTVLGGNIETARYIEDLNRCRPVDRPRRCVSNRGRVTEGKVSERRGGVAGIGLTRIDGADNNGGQGGAGCRRRRHCRRRQGNFRTASDFSIRTGFPEGKVHSGCFAGV